MKRGSLLTISFDFESINNLCPVDELPLVNMGYAAYDDKTRELVGELSVNLKAGPFKTEDPGTMEWWLTKNKEAYEIATKDPIDPRDAMIRVQQWVARVSKGYDRIQWVAYPSIYDGSMLYYYWFRFLGHPNNGRGPGFNVIDIRSYASGKLGITLSEASKQKALKKYAPSPDDFPHTHTGLDDAKEQAMLYFNIRDD
jgi:hypothetical protein